MLTYLRPDTVTVEISRFSLRYRLRHGPHWQRQLAQALSQLPPEAASHLAIRRLAAQVAMPFEVRAARDFHCRHGVPWRPLDLGAVARQHLPRYGPELLNPSNLRAILDTPDRTLEEFVAAEFHRAHLALARLHHRPRLPGPADRWRRERFLARRLQRLVRKYHRVVHLGGWEHLVDWQDPRCLWWQLADPKPLRWLLDEADRLET
jgi:hypothetical protein